MRGGLNCGKLKGKDVCWGKKISLGAILGLFLFFLGQRAAALSVQETWESRDAGIVQQEKEAAEERTENLKENKRRKTVALTFDDGPHETWTPLLLDGLEERGVKATFFLMGENIAGNEKKQDSNNAAVRRKRTGSGPETGRDAERKKETRYYAGTGRGKIPKESRPAESGRIEDTPIFKALRVYRWKKSQEEEIKPYFIYNDNQLKDLIAKMPRNTRELCQVDGFGEVKAKKYGPEILKILEQFRDR